MGKPINYKKEIVLEAIHDSGAIITTVARRLGCEWITAKKYIELWEETKRAMADEEETILDLCESALYNSVKGGDTQSAKWVLSTKGKRRGFTERHEVTGADGKDLVPEKIKIEFINDAECKDT
jgi:hypothetical protein